MGEAGMVVTGDDGYARALRRLRTHGAETTYLHDVVGGNFRMDAIQAAVLNVKLRYLEKWTERRREKARRVHGALSGKRARFERAGRASRGDSRSRPSPVRDPHQRAR